MSDDLSRAMRATAENLTPDVGRLTAGGVQRGVRRRRMRRVSQIAGAAASVTAVFGVVAAVGGTGSGPTPASAAAGSQTSATSTSAGPTAPSATPSSSPASSTQPKGSELAPTSAPSVPPVSGDTIATLLQQALAANHFDPETVLHKTGTEVNGTASAVLKVGFSAGIGNISVVIERSPWAAQQYGSSLPPYISIKDRPDGSHLTIFDGPEWPSGNGDPSAKRLDVSWYRTDGIMINVEALNEATEKGDTTATAVPLTVEQATAIATSPVWNDAARSSAYQSWVTWQNRASGADKGGAVPGGAVPGGEAAKPTRSSAH
ncbi:hypothetical protein GCM10009839_64420 [Catenulispora yoronensis]|uniref:Uncharacterized protein n=1 Tax=Catenulispora yoronensis TaxID=450799 RepID=A0ABP5GNZ7_9ACTN